MNRGEIWWANLREPAGSEPGFRRPVLVIQSDIYNQSKILTVICIAITSNLNLASIGKNVLLKKEESLLPKDSVINVSQIITLDKTYLEECIGAVRASTLKKVVSGVQTVLDL
jgi:mRNA interferase MazF